MQKDDDNVNKNAELNKGKNEVEVSMYAYIHIKWRNHLRLYIHNIRYYAVISLPCVTSIDSLCVVRNSEAGNPGR